MNKTEMLQFHGLFNVMATELDADTPAYDDLSFTPIVSDRFAHAEAPLRLCDDILAHLDAEHAEATDADATPISAD